MDLPVTARPHDSRIGPDGWIWFNHFNGNAIGRLNPETGETQEWRWPYRADEGSFAPTGARTLMGPDARGRWYIGNQVQGGLVVFDPATEQFQFVDPPGGGEMIDVSAAHIDGYGWRVGGGAAYRIKSRHVGGDGGARPETARGIRHRGRLTDQRVRRRAREPLRLAPSTSHNL